MAIGWVELADADTYMSTRLNSGPYWYSGVDKTAALQTAYYDLIDAGIFSFPETATEQMKRAQYEQALFRLRGETGLDERTDLQAQGVVSAGIMKETYRTRNGTVICGKAMDILRDYDNRRGGVKLFSISRDRTDEDV